LFARVNVLPDAAGSAIFAPSAIGVVPPTRSNSRSWSTRSRLRNALAAGSTDGIAVALDRCVLVETYARRHQEERPMPVGRTSMTIRVEARRRVRTAEEHEQVTAAVFVYVAVDEAGRPRPVPSLDVVR
jgi:hypothetical protein